MIRKILKIQDYGIFRDFSWNSNLKDFDSVNLFYGLNGSGKSTLATIFDDIKNGDQRYYHGEFKIDDDQIGVFSSSNLNNLNYNLYVFDTHFINDNIGEFDQLKGIVYLSESNKETKEKLDALKIERNKLSAKQTNLNRAYNESNKNLDNAYISAAKSIKEEFHVIGGKANIYSNYNKATFQQAIKNYHDFLLEQHDLCDILKRIDTLKAGLKDEIKDAISFEIQKFQARELLNQAITAQGILSTKIKSRVQDKIEDALFSWLEEGYRIHKDEKFCHYCGNLISQERQAFLNQLFDTELQELQNQILDIQTKIQNSLIPELNISESMFYSSLRDEAQKSIEKFRKIRGTINTAIEQILSKLKDKQKNPFDSIELKIELEAEVKEIQQIVGKIYSLIQSNTAITQKYSDAQIAAIKEIEKLLVYCKYVGGNISSLENSLKKATSAVKDLEVELVVIDNQIALCENDLIDVIKASSNFNDLLSRFLGRKELELKYDNVSKGYRIIRRESGNSAQFLSEGEKTAIAFVYFLTKVRENGNDINNSIIVFDDPISSLDSNHLFNAYAFIEAYFGECRQLFVLTHNFNFFKLLRKKHQKSPMYLIENVHLIGNTDGLRNASIANLPKSIMQASSEYHYLFEKIYKFHKNYSASTEIEFDDYMQMANTCRKVVESFAAFKVQNVNNLLQKIQSLYKCGQAQDYKLTSQEQNKCERIYRFINAFSHDSVFEDSGETDIVFGELDAIVSDVLALIERADKDHYTALLNSL